jgi:hypothetical protein
MNRPVAIVMTLAGYSVAEFFLLWLYTVTPHFLLPSQELSYLLLPFAIFQSLAIAGLAALLLSLIYGSRMRLRRLIWTVLFGPVVFVVSVLVVAVSIATGSWSYGALPFRAGAITIDVLVWGIVFVLMPTLLFRRLRQRSVDIEAEHWLAERGLAADKRRRRNAAIGWSLWTPIVLVGFSYLFFLECWGVFTHFQSPGGIHLSGYRVQVPLRWIIGPHFSSGDDGLSYVHGYAGGGPALTGIPDYVHMLESLSHWEVSTTGFSVGGRSPDDLERGQDVISKRTVSIPNGTLTCVQHHLDWQSRIWIECTGAGRLNASFLGRESEREAFYGMLGDIQPEPLAVKSLFPPPRPR